MKIVLDGVNIVDALTKDTHKVLDTLRKICDQIIVNELINREYERNRLYKAVYSSLLRPELERLRESKPKSKFHETRMGPGAKIPLPAHHSDLIQGAIRSQANIVIIDRELRGRWRGLARRLQAEHQLRVVTPDQYIAERGPNR